MSIRQGSNIIASTGNGSGLQMFDFKWSDHTINDLNWILSSSNTWHSGSTYKKMYQHLVNDYTSGESLTETIGTTTITYVLAPDGHKVVNAENELNAQLIYAATGVAWYYAIDTENIQFKLPRTKYAFNSGTIDSLGDYIEPGLPNITGTLSQISDGNIGASASGAFQKTQSTGYAEGSGQANQSYGVQVFNFNASKSNSIYGNSTTVQPPATSLLLYFYTNQFAINNSGSSGGGTVSITYDETNKRLIFESEG